jgi:hypothetical protein
VDYKTRITGHSLGGAMACIFMMDLVHDGVAVDQVVTFGQPRVTNDQGGRGFAGAPYLRIINDQDLVPQVPFSNLFYDLSGTYEHFGPEIALQADGKWTCSNMHVPRDFLTRGNWKQIDLENATDHQVKNYISRITAVSGLPAAGVPDPGHRRSALQAEPDAHRRGRRQASRNDTSARPRVRLGTGPHARGAGETGPLPAEASSAARHASW